MYCIVIEFALVEFSDNVPSKTGEKIELWMLGAKLQSHSVPFSQESLGCLRGKWTLDQWVGIFSKSV